MAYDNSYDGYGWEDNPDTWGVPVDESVPTLPDNGGGDWGYQPVPYSPPEEPVQAEPQYQQAPIESTSNGGSVTQPDNQGGGNNSQQQGESFDPKAWLENLSQATHTNNVGETDLAQIQGKKAEDLPQFLRDLEAQYARRGAPTASAGGQGGDADTNNDGLIDAGWNFGSGGQWTFSEQGGGPVSPKGGSGYLDYWHKQGVTDAQIFDNNGQLRPGWTHVQNGYAYTPPAGTQTGGSGGGRSSGGSGGLSSQDLLNLLGGLGGQVAGPGEAGVFNGPLQQVGQDPFSQILSGGYANLLGNEGSTSFGNDITSTLSGLISRGGQISEDPATKAARFEAARQPIDAMRKAQIAGARGTLANRGLLSEPGMPQGSEIGAMGRIEENLAPAYATAAQNLASEQANADNERLGQALTLATGLSQAQAQTFLATLQGGTERQKVLSDIALGALDRNIVWNQFLAQLGLDRARVLYAAQNQGVEALLPLLQMFSQFVQISSGGYV